MNSNTDIPWHRVINSKGEISNRGDGGQAIENQRQRLEEEGIQLITTTANTYKVNLNVYQYNNNNQ